MHGIVPPYLLEAIAENGTPAQKEAARLTLETDAQLRADRAESAAAPAEIAVPAAPRPHKNRKVYSSGNTAALPGTLIRSEGQAGSGDVGVDEAYDGLGDTFDLYWDIHDRNSWDDRGGDLIATVHYLTNYNNAFWSGTQMAFGDGDGKTFHRFTFALDVIGHELTHGVIDGRLPYSDQSGALNESIADVFGSLVKQRKLGQTAEQADWLIGAGMFVPRPDRRASRLGDRSADVYTGVNGIALRSMSAPGTAYHDPVFIHPQLSPDGKDPQPDHMRGYVTTSLDKGGVHINSGIPNKAFYLAAIAIGGFAWEIAGRIWYRALFDRRLPYNAGFQEFATLTAMAAEDLAMERGGGDFRNKVVSAWHEVGVGGDSLHLNRSAAFNAPKAVGAPSGIAFPSLDVTNIVYRDAQGRLHELWQKRSDEGTSNLTNLAGNPAHAATDPTSYIDTSQGLEVALYRGADGHVHSLYWSTGGVGHDPLSGAAGAPPTAGKPAGFIQKDGTSVVVYRVADGHLHALWWTGPNLPGHENLSGTHPKAAGDPVGYVNTITGENLVAYRGTDDHIHTLYWTTGAAGHDNLSAVATAPKAAGDPIAYYTEHNDTHQILYRGVDNHIHELYWPSPAPVQHRDLTAEANAPAAASDPAAYYVPTNNTKHVIYRSADNRIREIWWVIDATTPSEVNVTDSARAPLAADNLTAFFFPNAGTQHIAYRGADNHIHEIRWI